MLNFCAQSAEELLKFLEDLKESIAEVSEMEQIRIECKTPTSTTTTTINNADTTSLSSSSPSPATWCYSV